MVVGKNTKEMVRELSYFVFILKEARKFLFVNDEKENATFGVHHFDEGTDWKEYRSKQMLRALAETQPGLVAAIDFRRGMDGFIEDVQAFIEQAYDPSASSSVESQVELEGTWLSDTEIGKRAGVRVEGVRRWVEKLRLPEDAPDRVNDKGIVEHWGQLSDRVIEMLDRPTAPSEWLNIRQFASECGRSRVYADKLLAPLLAEHPEWEEYYYTQSERGRGVLSAHYSPEALAEVKKQLEAVEYAPTGWRTEKWMSTHYGGGQKKYGRVADTYRESNPDWFKPYLTAGGKKGGRTHEHFSPELVAAILQDLGLDVSEVVHHIDT